MHREFPGNLSETVGQSQQRQFRGAALAAPPTESQTERLGLEQRRHRCAVIRDPGNIVPARWCRGWTFDGLNQPQQRDGAGFVVDPSIRNLVREAGYNDPLPAHVGGDQGWVNGCVYARLAPTDEFREGGQHVLHADGAVEAAGEPEVHKRWKVRTIGYRIQSEQGNVSLGKGSWARGVAIPDVSNDPSADRLVMAGEPVEGERAWEPVIDERDGGHIC